MKKNVITMNCKIVRNWILPWWLVWTTTITVTTFPRGAMVMVNADGFVAQLDTEVEPSLAIKDVSTSIPNVKTLFINKVHAITVTDIGWTEAMSSSSNSSTSNSDFLFWTTSIDGMMVGNGNISLTLAEIGRSLPTFFDAGNFMVSSNGKHTVEVRMTVGEESELIASANFVAYRSGVAIIPMILVLVMAMTTQQV
jgi:hypothetical protein